MGLNSTANQYSHYQKSKCLSNNIKYYLYDKKRQIKKTDKKLNRWLEKWGERTPWWIKINEDGYMY